MSDVLIDVKYLSITTFVAVTFCCYKVTRGNVLSLQRWSR